jgi:phosphoribosyl 1,2-cyclic phosphate phosphodiesterase
MNFTITILGSGPSTGVPHPCCTCKTCTSTDPRNQRLRPGAYLRTSSGRGYLIDVSPDIREQVLRYGIDRVDGVMITHEHADHVLGLDYLRLFNFIQKKAIPLFANPTVLRSIKSMFSYIFKPDLLYKGGRLAQFLPTEIDDLTPFKLDELTIQPFPMFHGRVRATGYRIGNMSYATDCHEIPTESQDIIRGCETLFLDALSYESHPTHFNIEQAVQMAAHLQIPRTFLMHMTHNLEYNSLKESLPKGIEPAYDGLSIQGIL